MPQPTLNFQPRLIALTLLLASPATANAADENFEAAGCYIANEQGVLVNKNRLLNRLQLPIGRRSANETPKETAERETLEETGLKVNANVLLMKLNNGKVFLYACTPKENEPTLKPIDTVEVGDVYWLNPHTLQNHRGETVDTKWRFPQTLVLLMTLFSRRE